MLPIPTWTGKGWLALPLVAVTLLVGGLIGASLGSGSGAALLAITIAFAAAAFPSYLLGRALNSSVGHDVGATGTTATASGRVPSSVPAQA